MSPLPARFLVAITLLSQLSAPAAAQMALPALTGSAMSTPGRCLQLFALPGPEADIFYYQAVIAIEGESLWSLDGLFKSYYSERSFEQAQEVAARMVQLFPDSAIARKNKERVRSALRRQK